MFKKCCYCDIEKPLKDFHKNRARKDGVTTVCKECQKDRSKKLYNREKSLYGFTRLNKNRARRIQKRRDLLYHFKASCIICGEDDPLVVDFHHIKDKIEDVSKMIINSRNIKDIEEEIKKCVPLCSNCHRKYHSARFSLLTDNPKYTDMVENAGPKV